MSSSPSLEPPSPSYSRSTSVRGNSYQTTQVLGYSSNPDSQPSENLSPGAQEAQYASVVDESFEEKQRNARRGNEANENGYLDEKKKRNSYKFVDVKNLKRPINYTYMGTIFVHFVILLFFAIVLGLSDMKDSGFDTSIPPGNLDIKQSAINLVTAGFGVVIIALVTSLAQSAATHRLFERRQDLTYLSDSLTAWGGPLAALKSLLNHATEQVQQKKLTVELAIVALYLVLCALIGGIFSSIFTLGVYDASIPAMAAMVPSSRTPFANISDAGYFGPGKWVTMASAVYTNQLQNQSQIAGYNHNRMYSYLDTETSSISGSVMAPATDLDVRCQSVRDFDLSLSNTSEIFELGTYKFGGYPFKLFFEFEIEGVNFYVEDSIPWKSCSKWGDTELLPIRTTHLAPGSKGRSRGISHPISFFLHYSCTKDPAPQNCTTLNNCNPLRDAKGVWAHTTELLPLIPDYLQNLNFSTTLQTETDAQGHLLDFGLGVSLLACSASATKAEPVRVSLPENTIKDFPDPAIKLRNSTWSVFEAPPPLDNDYKNSVHRFSQMFSHYGAPIYASLSPFDSQSAISDVDPNINCFDNSEICHPTTLVEHYINYQIAGLQNNTNELAGLELVLQNVTTTALSNAAAFIRNVKYGTQPLNPDYEDDYPEYDRANEANFQNFNMTAEKLVQRTKLTLNKWPLIIGISGAAITLIIAFILLRPLPEGTPLVKGTDLIHITRLLSLSDIPERMRSSPSTFHGMRAHGRFATRLDGGGSTLLSETALLSTTGVSPNTLPIISPSRSTGFVRTVSFRDRNAKTGLDLIES